jgi:hypothetical protein
MDAYLTPQSARVGREGRGAGQQTAPASLATPDAGSFDVPRGQNLPLGCLTLALSPQRGEGARWRSSHPKRSPQA